MLALVAGGICFLGAGAAKKKKKKREERERTAAAAAAGATTELKPPPGMRGHPPVRLSSFHFVTRLA